MKLLVTTAPEGKAGEIARALVSEKLVACANIIRGVSSIYWWKGAVEEASESLILMKTTPELAHAALRRLAELHPYEVPEGVVLDIEGGLPPYLRWIADSTGTGTA
jgi:periplasmic divalent cation tolerance protein